MVIVVYGKYLDSTRPDKVTFPSYIIGNIIITDPVSTLNGSIVFELL